MKITIQQFYDYVREELEKEVDASYFSSPSKTDESYKHHIPSTVHCYTCGNKQSNSKIYTLVDCGIQFFIKCRKCNTYFKIPKVIRFRKATAAQVNQLIINELVKR